MLGHVYPMECPVDAAFCTMPQLHAIQVPLRSPSSPMRPNPYTRIEALRVYITVVTQDILTYSSLVSEVSIALNGLSDLHRSSEIAFGSLRLHLLSWMNT